MAGFGPALKLKVGFSIVVVAEPFLSVIGLLKPVPVELCGAAREKPLVEAQDWEVPVPKAELAIPNPEASFAGVPNAEGTGTAGWSAGFPREKPGVAAAGLLPCETGAPSEKAGLSVLVPFVIGGKEKPEKAAGFADGLDDAAVVLPWVFGAEIF